MKNITTLMLSGMLMVSLAFSGQAAEQGPYWRYDGDDGPAHWGELSPEFALCGEGKAQSPIDLDDTYPTTLDSIVFAFQETPLKIINNGRTIQINYPPGRGTAIIDGQRYTLLQFHFHSPSEHTVQGKFFDMELHLVYQNDQGDLAVVGVFLIKGQPHDVLQMILDHLPAEVSQEQEISDVTLNVTDLLPEQRDYYHYFGSLTTPPCSEGVNWSVLKTPIEVSEVQIAQLKTAIGFANNRPVQPLNKRFVLESKT